MVEINTWLTCFLQALQSTFGNRVWFVGLQGSYARGEATETSDIDMVVILDELSSGDIRKYDAMLDTMAHRELLCGFLAGRNELLHWEAADLFQFYYDTKPIQGSLDVLLQQLDDIVVNRAIKTGACNIYHGCVHNMLYEESEEILYGLYKSASFVIQAICFQKTGSYMIHHEDLLNAVNAQERRILEIFWQMKQNQNVHFVEMSDILFNWAKKWISQGDET